MLTLAHGPLPAPRRSLRWALLCALALAPPACQDEAREPPAEAAAVAPTGPAGPAPTLRPRGPFRPEKLRCARLLTAEAVTAVLGFTPEWVERANRRDGETTVLCANKSALPSQGLSYQVSCGAKRPPSAFQTLRALHEKALGAAALPGEQGVTTPSSYLALHPSRPCFVQVTSRAAARVPGAVSRLGVALAAAVP